MTDRFDWSQEYARGFDDGYEAGKKEPPPLTATGLSMVMEGMKAAERHRDEDEATKRRLRLAIEGLERIRIDGWQDEACCGQPRGRSCSNQCPRALATNTLQQLKEEQDG